MYQEGEKKPKHSNIDGWMCPKFAYFSHRLESIEKILTLREQKYLRKSLHSFPVPLSCKCFIQTSLGILI